MADVVPTERELQALKVIWQRGSATVREICDAIGERGETLAYTTVLSLLQVMEQKGLVGHTAQGKVYSYFAHARREPTFRRLARGFLDTVFDGALDEYLVHALEARELSPDEFSRLEAMITEARRRSTEAATASGDTAKSSKPSRRTNRRSGEEKR